MCIHAACILCAHTQILLFPLFTFHLNAVLHSHLPSILKNLHLAVCITLSRGSFWLMKAHDRLWTAGEWGFSIQTNNRAESVSVNGDQACQDEEFGDSGGLGTPPLSPSLQ